MHAGSHTMRAAYHALPCTFAGWCRATYLHQQARQSHRSSACAHIAAHSPAQGVAHHGGSRMQQNWEVQTSFIHARNLAAAMEDPMTLMVVRAQAFRGHCPAAARSRAQVPTLTRWTSARWQHGAKRRRSADWPRQVQGCASDSRTWSPFDPSSSAVQPRVRLAIYGVQMRQRRGVWLSPAGFALLCDARHLQRCIWHG